MTNAQPANRQHPPTPLGMLFNRYKLSLRTAEGLLANEGCKVSSPATISRLIHNNLSPAVKAEIGPPMSRVLSKFLFDQGLSKAQIDSTLLEIFDEGEYQPMISKRNKLNDEECRYFGFLDENEKPLDPFTTDPARREDVFMPPPIREIFDTVMDAIKYRHFVAVLGPIGSGKTTLRNCIEDAIAADQNIKVVWPEFFDQSKVSAYEIARTILNTFGMVPPGRSAALGTAVKAKLQSLTQNGQRIALGFDEGHKLNKLTIRSLKNFFEMSSGGFQKYLGIFILAWPIFEDILSMPEFQEVYERIHILHMPEFSTYAQGYFSHRLKLVGANIEDLFDDEAVDMICSQAETPLSLGNIANEALRISKESFGEHRVIGAAIKTKMFFETGRDQAFRKR